MTHVKHDMASIKSLLQIFYCILKLSETHNRGSGKKHVWCQFFKAELCLEPMSWKTASQPWTGHAVLCHWADPPTTTPGMSEQRQQTSLFSVVDWTMHPRAPLIHSVSLSLVCCSVLIKDSYSLLHTAHPHFNLFLAADFWQPSLVFNVANMSMWGPLPKLNSDQEKIEQFMGSWSDWLGKRL